ncbi:hypothetical protein C6A85_11360, partial [Mycobacterium sp. ITM-2017-0098]
MAAAAHSTVVYFQPCRWRETLCAAAAIVVALEITEIGSIATGFKQHYWTPGGPGTWPHAILV